MYWFYGFRWNLWWRNWISILEFFWKWSWWVNGILNVFLNQIVNVMTTFKKIQNSKNKSYCDLENIIFDQSRSYYQNNYWCIIRKNCILFLKFSLKLKFSYKLNFTHTSLSLWLWLMMNIFHIISTLLMFNKFILFLFSNTCNHHKCICCI